MTLEYIDNPIIVSHKSRLIIREVLMSAETNRWIVVSTTITKTGKDRTSVMNKMYQARKTYAKYTHLEWAVHDGVDNYSFIVRKTEGK